MSQKRLEGQVAVVTGASRGIGRACAEELARAWQQALTLTNNPGASLTPLYGEITVGNTATAQTAAGLIDDGANNLCRFLNPMAVSNTLALEVYVFPQTSNTAALIGTDIDFLGPVSG